MKYMTKKWFRTKHYSFPMKLEVIDSNKNDIEQIFITEYNNTFNKMKSKLPENDGEYVFKNIFNGYLENVKQFFDRETLNKIADIRLLALGKVFEDEYIFVEKEIINKDAMQAYYKEFSKIKDKISMNIKNNLNLHDSLITNIIKEKDKLIIKLDSSNSFGNIENIVFEDYKIIEEEMNFINGWCLYEEIYIVENQYELHLLIDVPNKKDSKLGYFTIRAKDIIFE